MEMRVTSRDGDQVAEVSYRLAAGLTRTTVLSLQVLSATLFPLLAANRGFHTNFCLRMLAMT